VRRAAALLGVFPPTQKVHRGARAQKAVGGGGTNSALHTPAYT
jgi:hypothetical protein